MGTNRQGDEEVRKIQQTGEAGASYYITLPIEDIRKLRWQVDQKVTVTLDEANQQLIIRDWQG